MRIKFLFTLNYAMNLDEKILLTHKLFAQIR